MTLRLVSLVVLVAALQADAQVYFLQPIQPAMVMPNWLPMQPLQPVPVAVAAPTVPVSPPTRRVERFYFDVGSGGRPLLPPDTAARETSTASTVMVALPVGSTVVREYYYVDADPDYAKLQPVPNEKPPIVNLEPLKMPEPAEALKKAEPKSPLPQKIPASSTDPRAGKPADSDQKSPFLKPEERGYLNPNPNLPVDPKNALDQSTGFPEKPLPPLRVTGLFRSARGGALLGDMKLGLVHADGRFADRSITTDRMGRFETALEPGRWLVYFIDPDGGRRFLRTAVIELSDNATIAVEG